MTGEYTVSVEIPSVEDYCRLRHVSGLTPRSPVAAAAGLPNTVVGVLARCSDHVVGMGRVIGDGLCYQVVDIAVDAVVHATGSALNGERRPAGRVRLADRQTKVECHPENPVHSTMLSPEPEERN